MQPNQRKLYTSMFCTLVGMDDTAYLLLMKDDASSFCWLFPCYEAEGVNVTRGILQWFSTFSVTVHGSSDEESDFKNKLMGAVNKNLHCKHRFSSKHVPHTNGATERLCQEFSRSYRSIISELSLKEMEWLSVVPILKSVLNNSERNSMSGKAPITFFTELPAYIPINLIVIPRTSQVKRIDESQMQRNINATKLENLLDVIHLEVHKNRKSERNRNSTS